MYSEHLEMLIDAAISDGEISQKEREIIHKHAIAEGIDIDEIDMVIDGRAAKIRREMSASQPVAPAPQPVAPAPQAPKTSYKYGEIRKCPQCGAVIEPGSVKCGECDYVLTGIEANHSVEKLSKMIDDVRATAPKSSGGMFGMMMGGAMGADDTSKRIASIITNFPVPTAKEDLLEFLLFLQPKTKMSRVGNSMGDDLVRKAYKNKYEECYQKAKLFFKDDPIFQQIFHENKSKGFSLFGKKK